jgi:AcrR family transcriptional regulator
MRKKQIEESQNLIIDAFFDLLKHRRFQDITISAIADSSSISRMTIYRHFKDKESIARKYIQNILDSLFENLKLNESNNFNKLLLSRNELIYRDEKIRIALDHKEIESIYNKLINDNRVKCLDFSKVGHIDADLEIFVMGGVTQLTNKWISDGFKISPEKVTQIMMRFVKAVVRHS